MERKISIEQISRGDRVEIDTGGRVFYWGTVLDVADGSLVVDLSGVWGGREQRIVRSVLLRDVRAHESVLDVASAVWSEVPEGTAWEDVADALCGKLFASDAASRAAIIASPYFTHQEVKAAIRAFDEPVAEALRAECEDGDDVSVDDVLDALAEDEYDARRERQDLEDAHGVWLDGRIVGRLPILLSDGESVRIVSVDATDEDDHRYFLRYLSLDEPAFEMRRSQLLAEIADVAEDVRRAESAAGWDPNP